VQPGDRLAASAGGGGAAPFRRWTHGVVGLELAGGCAPRGVGFVACGPDLPSTAGAGGRWRLRRWRFGARAGAVVQRSLLCHPSPHGLVYCCGRGVSRATVRSRGSGSSVVMCGVGIWAAVAPAAFAVVRMPADLACRSGCCQGWSTGGATHGATAARPGPWAQPEVVAVRAALRLLWQPTRHWPSGWVCVGWLGGDGCGGVLCPGVLAGRCAGGLLGRKP
jgi:hypothetical protein